jgi:hypothetical protein
MAFAPGKKWIYRKRTLPIFLQKNIQENEYVRIADPETIDQIPQVRPESYPAMINTDAGSRTGSC